VRKDGVVKSAVARHEKSQLRAKNNKYAWLSKLWKVLGYLSILIVLMCMAGPALVMNYVRTQVKNGEWVSVDPIIIEGETDTEAAAPENPESSSEENS